jgi:hypothetical protein
MSESDFVHVSQGIADYFASVGRKSHRGRRGCSYPGWLAARTLDRLPDMLLLAIEKAARAIGSAVVRLSLEAERARLRRASRNPERLGEGLDLVNQRLDQLDIEDQEDGE